MSVCLFRKGENIFVGAGDEVASANGVLTISRKGSSHYTREPCSLPPWVAEEEWKHVLTCVDNSVVVESSPEPTRIFADGTHIGVFGFGALITSDCRTLDYWCITDNSGTNLTVFRSATIFITVESLLAILQ